VAASFLQEQAKSDCWAMTIFCCNSRASVRLLTSSWLLRSANDQKPGRTVHKASGNISVPRKEHTFHPVNIGKSHFRARDPSVEFDDLKGANGKQQN
jgi:hypothetical protein